MFVQEGGVNYFPFYAQDPGMTFRCFYWFFEIGYRFRIINLFCSRLFPKASFLVKYTILLSWFTRQVLSSKISHPSLIYLFDYNLAFK